MLTRLLPLCLTALLAGSAMGQLRASALEQQARDRRMGVTTHTQPSSNLVGVPAAIPQPTRSFGGVPAALPQPQRNIGGTKVTLPFTRMGPTARTIGQDQAEQEAGFNRPLPGRGTPTRNTPPHPVVTPDVVLPPQNVIILPPGRGFILDARPFLRTGIVTTGTFLGVDRGFIDASSVSFSGGFDDGNFRLRFNVGSGGIVPIAGPVAVDPRFFTFIHRPRTGLTVALPLSRSIAFRGGCADGVCGLPSNAIYGSVPEVDPAVMVKTTLPAEPQPQPEIPLASEAQRGDLLMRAGQAKQAIAAYQAHLRSDPGDTYTMRSLGLAMIANSQFKDGVAMVSLAYKSDPALAIESIPPEFFGSRNELRRMVERVSMYANRTRVPGAWLSLAALMQAEGRTELALKMLDRGREAGLEPEIAAQMTAALKY